MDPTIAQANRVMGVLAIWACGSRLFFFRNKNAVRREEWLHTGQTTISAIMLGEQQVGDLGSNVLTFSLITSEQSPARFFVSGYEVCRRMRNNPLFENTLIIAQTGWGQERDREMAKEAGFDHHLVKPLKIEDITALFEKVVV